MTTTRIFGTMDWYFAPEIPAVGNRRIFNATDELHRAMDLYNPNRSIRTDYATRIKILGGPGLSVKESSREYEKGGGNGN